MHASARTLLAVPLHYTVAVSCGGIVEIGMPCRLGCASDKCSRTRLQGATCRCGIQIRPSELRICSGRSTRFCDSSRIGHIRSCRRRGRASAKPRPTRNQAANAKETPDVQRENPGAPRAGPFQSGFRHPRGASEMDQSWPQSLLVGRVQT